MVMKKDDILKSILYLYNLNDALKVGYIVGQSFNEELITLLECFTNNRKSISKKISLLEKENKDLKGRLFKVEEFIIKLKGLSDE